MQYSFKHHHFIYVAAFVLLAATATSTIFGAEPQKNNNVVPLNIVATQTEQSFLLAVDVDPLDPARPTYSQVGSTIKITWDLLDTDAKARLFVSEDNGENWSFQKAVSSAGSSLYTIEPTETSTLLFKVESENNVVTSTVVTLQ